MHRVPRLNQRLSRRRLLQFGALGGVAVAAGFGGSLIWANQAVRRFADERIVPLTPWLVNTYLLRGERPILVDTGFPADATVIEAGLAARGVAPHELALIFVTHGHYDHFGSAAAIKGSGSVPVSIHPVEAERLRAGVTTPVHVLTATGQLARALASDERPPVPVEPDVMMGGGDRLDAFGVQASVLHTPGHTTGSLSLLIDGIALIGDLLAGNLLYPDRPEYPFFIDDPADQPRILSSLAQLLEAGAHTFYPGHGLPFGREAALRWLENERAY